MGSELDPGLSNGSLLLCQPFLCLLSVCRIASFLLLTSFVRAQVRAVVKGEEEIASRKAAGAKAIKDDTEADLAEAMPQLEAALRVRVSGFCAKSYQSLVLLFRVCLTCQSVNLSEDASCFENFFRPPLLRDGCNSLRRKCIDAIEMFDNVFRSQPLLRSLTSPPTESLCQKRPTSNLDKK